MVGEVVDCEVLPVQAHVREQVQLVPKEEDLHSFTPLVRQCSLTSLTNLHVKVRCCIVVHLFLYCQFTPLLTKHKNWLTIGPNPLILSPIV